MITRSISANRPSDHNNNEKHLNQSFITEFNIARKSEKITVVFQSQTETTSVISNQNINTENTERTLPTEVFEISLPSRSLTQGNTEPLQVPEKMFGSNSDFHKESNLFEKSASQKKATSRQCQFQKIAILPFWQNNLTQWNLQRYIQVTDFLKHFQITQLLQINRTDLMIIHLC